MPDPPAAAPAPSVGAADAYALADPGAAPAPAATAPHGAEQVTDFAGGGRASLVRYRDGAADRLGWRLLIPAGSSAFYDAIVDARTGRLQRRTNRVRFDGFIRHVDLNPRAEGGVTAISILPPAWDDPGPYLNGPYAHAFSDLDDTIALAQGAAPFGLTSEPDASDEVDKTGGTDAEPQFMNSPTLGPPSFCSPHCSWAGNNRTVNRAFSAQQLFWYVNTFRDHLATSPIGFTAASGGFEGGDRVLAQALDGALTNPAGATPDADHVSNASMLTLPDGYRPLLTTHLFAIGTSRYDGAHDASLVYHEYAHGLSERLVTDAQGFGALSGAQPGAVSEGTSDFYALDFLEAANEVNDTATPGEIRLGNWLQSSASQKGLTGTVRTEGLDCPAGDPAAGACPGTPGAGEGGYDYADFGRVAGAPEIHSDGEIWAQTLWSLRTALIQARGQTVGIERTRAYVTGGLRLAPEDPTLLDMRNAIVQAAVNAHGAADWQAIWGVFAARGMGWSASAEGPNDVTPFAAHDIPPPPGSPNRGAVAGAIRDEGGVPVGGAIVSVAGHDSGLGATDLTAASGADGGYVVGSVPAGSYPDLYVRKAGFQEATTGVDVAAGATSVVNFLPLRRDYASLASGAGVAGFSGADFSGTQCGPGQVLDDDKSTVWSTYADEGAQDLIVDLGRQIDVREVRIDPRAGCGDSANATLSRYELAVSDGPGEPYERIAGGIVGAPDPRGYVTLPLAGDASGRRLLRLRALEPRSLAQETTRPFMDVAELEVTGTPAPVAPEPTPTPTPTATPTVKRTVLRGARLRANRKGMLKVKVRFGDRAPKGRARLRVLAGKRTYAVATLAVRPGPDGDQDAPAQQDRAQADQARELAQGDARAAPAGRREGQEEGPARAPETLTASPAASGPSSARASRSRAAPAPSARRRPGSPRRRAIPRRR